MAGREFSVHQSDREMLSTALTFPELSLVMQTHLRVLSLKPSPSPGGGQPSLEQRQECILDNTIPCGL